MINMRWKPIDTAPADVEVLVGWRGGAEDYYDFGILSSDLLRDPKWNFRNTVTLEGGRLPTHWHELGRVPVHPNNHGIGSGVAPGKKKTHVYISGPMKGMPDHNRKVFMEAEEKLISLGCDVINPFKLGEDIKAKNPKATIRDFLATDLDMLCRYADAMVVVGTPADIENSSGVSAEIEAAYRIGVPMFWDSNLGDYEGLDEDQWKSGEPLNKSLMDWLKENLK